MFPIYRFATVCLLAGMCTGVLADSYRAPVTRKGHNVYQVEGLDLMIVTQSCSLQAYSEDAILETTGNGGKMTLVHGKDSCRLRGVYAPMARAPGRYGLTVSLKAENWYEIFGTHTYLKTRDCKVMVLAEEASLLLPGTGLGQIDFKNGDNCKVEAVFARKRL